MAWDQINFFTNPFSDDIGDVLFGAGKKGVLDFRSPDSSSDGNLKKRWKILDGKRCLLKGGSNPYRQQPFNEVIASELMERLSIPHVPYTMIWDDQMPYSVCGDFISEETELIPAWRILQTQKKPNSQSLYQHFIVCAESLGIPDVVPFLDRMITLDYMIANEDRHFNNFGAVPNAETLEWIGMAPIYDSGTSLGFDKVASEILAERNVTCRPFKKAHEEQLKLVRDFSWINFDRLVDVRDMICGILSVKEAEDYMDRRRIEAIADSVKRRIERVRELSEKTLPVRSDSIEGDVTDHAARSYD